MGDEVTYTEQGRTYRVRGLQAKGQSISGGSHELDGLITTRLTAAKTALEQWRGPHAGTFVEDVNSVLSKMASQKVALWRAGNIVSQFPDKPTGSWGSVRYQDEIYMSARVDLLLDPGVTSAVTSQLRAYVTTSSGQDERFSTLAGVVNLDGVTADVTYNRPLTATERQQALDAGEHPADLDVTMVPQTDTIDPGTLITLPTPNADVPALTEGSRILNEFTLAVAVAFETGDQGMLDRLAKDPDALRLRLDWVREDPRRWNQLSETERLFLIQVLPNEVGAMDGLPIVVRDQANRIVLQRSREALQSRADFLRTQDLRPRPTPMPHPGETAPLSPADELAQIEEKLRGIDALERRLAGVPGRPPAFLVGFSADGTGRAIVAVGNPDYADNVVTYVPGTGSRLGKINGDIERADRMVGDANALAPSSSTSVITWLGYDAPQSLGQATSGRYADGGAGLLRHFQDGLDISHIGGPATETVVGHSYGTTVIGHAARDGHLNADNLILVASPGVGVDNVSGLHMDASHVYATVAANDPIQYTPPFLLGTKPTNPGFGAQVFESAPGSPSVHAHSEYWDDGNVARDNMAAIITGRRDLVTEPRPHPTPGPAPTPPR